MCRFESNENAAAKKIKCCFFLQIVLQYGRFVIFTHCRDLYDHDEYLLFFSGKEVMCM